MAFPRNVVVLGVASLLTDVASEMCLPLFPLLLASLGGGAAMLGLMEGAADTISALIKMASGQLSDRLKRRKPLVLIGYLLASVVRPINALATVPVHMLLLRATDRVGKGLRTAPRDALLAESVPSTERAAAFGFHRSMDHAGAVIGPLIAAGVLALGAGVADVRTVFLLSIIPGLGAVLVLLFGLKETAGVEKPKSPTAAAPEPAAPASPVAKLLLVVTTLFAAFRIQEVLLLAMLSMLGVAPALLPLAWSAMHLVKTLTGTPMGRLADRLGRERTLVTGYLVYAVTVLLAGFAPSPWLLLGAMLLYALHHGLTEGVEKALVSVHWPAARRGTAFGAYHALAAIVALPAGYAQGLALQHLGAEWLGGVLATGGLIAAALALAFAARVRRPAAP